MGGKRMGLDHGGGPSLRSEEGATAVEYALMIAFIALVIVLAVTFLGEQTSSVYENPQLLEGLS
jgi:Flp pilus assembly pilin Flp